MSFRGHKHGLQPGWLKVTQLRRALGAAFCSQPSSAFSLATPLPHSLKPAPPSVTQEGDFTGVQLWGSMVKLPMELLVPARTLASVQPSVQPDMFLTCWLENPAFLNCPPGMAIGDFVWG
jgi:hypothetical protein